MRPTVLLFDIDGTLVTTGGAGRKAVARAFEQLHGRPDACTGFSFDGMTDWGIFRKGLAAIGVSADEATIETLLARYLDCLAQTVTEVPEEHYVVHPLMREAVAAALDAGHAVGLGTGNVKRGAHLKLARVNLADKFAFGGFGDDHELRPELIRKGAERGAAHLGVPLAEARVVVIGDTPKDVSAAQAIGAESIAVATGGHTVEQLRESKPTWVFDSLAASGALDVMLGR